ncbi:MAG: ADOP family duplicated permease [Lacunisphaera sp.]
MTLKITFRRLARSPGFCAVSVLMLALGIAVSTLTFSVANSALLRPLPFPQPDRLVRVFSTSTQSAFMPLAPGDAIDLREALGDLGDFTLFRSNSANVFEPGGVAEQKNGLSVTPDFLRVLGIQPQLGRNFLPGEDTPEKSAVTLITSAYWHEHFAADPQVIGKLLRIESVTNTIVGVLPPNFDETALFRGLTFVQLSGYWRNWRTIRADRWLNVAGRLHPGVTEAQANARLLAFGANLSHDHPAEMRGIGLRITPLGTSAIRSQTIFWLLVALAALVLLIACANLGALQLARAFARRGELAVRTALGARRRELMVAIAAESVVVAAAGTGLGLLAVIWGSHAMGHWLELGPLPVDIRVIGYAGLLGVLAVVVFGLMPAWLASDLHVSDALKVSSHQSTGGRARGLKHALVVGQIGLALTLVSTAFSFVAGVHTFLHRERGWQAEGLVSGLTRFSYAWTLKEQENPTFAAQVRAQLGAIPGVQGVSVASGAPPYGSPRESAIYPADWGALTPGQEPRAQTMEVDAEFFRALRIPLRAGRLFPEVYRRTDPPMAIVSASLARQLWPDGTAIGKRIKTQLNGPSREIIGVVGDVNLAVGFDRAASTQQIYARVEETSGPWYGFILKTTLPATALERSIRQAFVAIDPDIMVANLGDVPQLLESFADNQPLTIFLTTFAAIGLLIALVGLYAMMSQTVNERRREIGVRLALGADGSRIRGMLLRSGGRLLLVGAVVGLAASYGAGRLLLRTMPELPMPGIGARLLIAAVLVAAGMIACYLPSRRASRVDPVEVLRAE